MNSAHKVADSSVYAVRQLQEKGIVFVINSARSPSGIYPILREKGIFCPIICYSGALVMDEAGNVLSSAGMDKKTAGEVVSFIETRGFDCSWNLYSVDTWIVKDRKDPRVVREEKIVHAEALEGTVDLLPEGAKIGKVLCMCAPDRIIEIQRELVTRFPDMSVVRSSDILLEIMAGGINKGGGVREFCRLKGIPVGETVGFGDHYNDAEMLEAVGLPFLMGNAPDDLKQRFPGVTRSCDEDGIYHALVSAGIILPLPAPGSSG